MPRVFFGWTLKPLTSAQTAIHIRPDGRRELTISRDGLKGVTPAMLHWWFCHMAATMMVVGRCYPRYQVWHPVDHMYYIFGQRKRSGQR